MKLLTLALSLAGFSICTSSAEVDVNRMRQKCHNPGGSIKSKGHEHAGQCRGKKGHMQAYDIPADQA